MWSVQTEKLLDILAGHEGPVSALAFSPTGSHLATYTENDGVFLWDMKGNESHPLLLPRSNSLGHSLRFTFNFDGDSEYIYEIF